MMNITISRPIIIVGKPGTGKTTKALAILGDDPIVQYADEYNIEDILSVPIDKGILIEEVGIKPNVKAIVRTLLQYKGQVVLTSYNQKDVPKKIYNLCKLKRAGTTNYRIKTVNECMQGSVPPEDYDINIFSLIHDYFKNPNRDDVLVKLNMNNPYDEQFLSWLVLNMHPSKVAYLDAKVKRRWSKDYFHELIAYAHNGKINKKVVIPSGRTYSKMPTICRKVGLKSHEEYLLHQLLYDDDFAKYVKSRVNNVERRTLMLGDSSPQKKTKRTTKGLSDY